MSEDIKKETQDEKLNNDKLEQAAGGYQEYDPGVFYQLRLIFNGEETDKIKKAFNVALEPYRQYAYSELSKLGIGGNSAQSVKDALSSIGVYKS